MCIYFLHQEEGYPDNIFVNSPRKHMMWVLIRSASAQHMFSWRSEKYTSAFGILGLTYLRLFYHVFFFFFLFFFFLFLFFNFIDHPAKMTHIDSFEFQFFITCLKNKT